MVHCSGGAQTKVLHFIHEDLHVIKDNLFDVPPLFKIIQEESKTPGRKCTKFSTWGTEWKFIWTKKFAHQVIEIAQQFNIDAKDSWKS